MFLPHSVAVQVDLSRHHTLVGFAPAFLPLSYLMRLAPQCSQKTSQSVQVDYASSHGSSWRSGPSWEALQDVSPRPALTQGQVRGCSESLGSQEPGGISGIFWF